MHNQPLQWTSTRALRVYIEPCAFLPRTRLATERQRSLAKQFPMKPITESTDGRIAIVPQSEDHAEEMYSLLKDADLYLFTDGRPPASAQELAKRFEKLQCRTSPDGKQWWLNWVIKKVESKELVGYVQATVNDGMADVAWVIGRKHQRNGYATKATELMVAQLIRMGCSSFTCHIKAEHIASNRVAQKVGFSETGTVEKGEMTWKMITASEQGAQPDAFGAG